MADPATSLQTAVPLIAALGVAAQSVYVARHGMHRVANLLMAGAGLVWAASSFARGVAAIQGPSEGTSRLVMTAGFLAPALFLALAMAFPRPSRQMTRAPALWALFAAPPVLGALVARSPPAGWQAERMLAWYALLLLGVASVRALWVRWYPEGGPERTRANHMLVAIALLGVPVVTALLGQPLWAGLLQDVAVAGAIASIAYSLLKYDLVGFDRRVRNAAKYLVTTGVIVAVLFLVSGYVGEFILEPMFGFTDYYWFIAGIVGLLLFKPLEHAVEWATGKLLPSADAGRDEAALEHGRGLYASQVRYILRDGAISQRERAFLDTLRTQLALPEEVAREVEATEQGARAPGRSASGTVKRAKGAKAARPAARRKRTAGGQ